MSNYYGYIYKITNNLNNKIYIGQKTSPVFVESYFGSGVKIKRAIEKYGRENFSREVLEWCNSRDELNEKEIYYIDKFNARDESVGYNLAVGGTVIGMKHSEEVKAKISAATIGKKRSEETRHRISVSHKGIKHTEESKKLLSEKMKLIMIGKNLGNKHTDEWKQWFSESRKGHPTSEETRRKISEANKGKVHSEESRKKMSESHKGLPAWNKGLKSNIADKIAVHNPQEKITIYIYEYELESYINNGWIKGNGRKGIPKKYPNRTRKVVCIETGQVFESIKKAEEWCHGSVIQCVKGGSKTAGGYHWKYFEDKEIADC